MRPDEDAFFVAVAAEASRPGRLTIASSEGSRGAITTREGDRSLLERITAGRSLATFDATTVGAELGPEARRSLQVFDVLVECRRLLHTEVDSIGDLVAALGGEEIEVAAAALGERQQIVKPSPQERATAALRGTRFLASRLDWNRVNVSQALLRGSYAAACGAMDERGIPVDAGTLANLLRARGAVRREALAGLGPLAGLFVGFALSGARGDAWARDRQLAWPRGRDGRPVSDHRTLQGLAAMVPELREVLEVASLLNQLAAPRMLADRDGRVRVSRRVCAASTGRDVFSGGFIFGQPRWMRRVISPTEGRAIVHVDIEAADIGVAAGLAADATMQAAYDAGFYDRLLRSLQAPLRPRRSRTPRSAPCTGRWRCRSHAGSASRFAARRTSSSTSIVRSRI